MVNAQQWLDKQYSRKERRNVSHLNISNEDLEGSLDLSGFINLKTLSCYSNLLTNINLTNNKKLEQINCAYAYNELKFKSKNIVCDCNQISNLDLSKNFQLVNLQCPGIIGKRVIVIPYQS